VRGGSATACEDRRVESVRDKEYRAVADRADASRKKAAETLEALQKASTQPDPMQIALLSAYQEQAKIDALHKISHELDWVRDAIESR
ncbi:hypothetical protein, partial [Mycolicibacterium conceptionense]|uniref:hypothetical protein n=1 Tax=Mycolicibacterium conceptionense TaxID=451644 RepID=UPI001950E2D0